MKRFLAAAGPIVLLAFATGCTLPLGMCIDEARNLSLDGTWEATGSTETIPGSVLVGMHEARNHNTKDTTAQEYFWSIRSSSIDRATVSAVHVHERDTDRLLFEIPIENTPGAPAEFITNSNRRPHNGAIAQWSEVYEILGSGRGYVDVHLGGSGEPVLRANLTPQHSNWRNFVHSSCS